MKKHNDQPINEVLRNMLKTGPLQKGYYDSMVKTIWRDKIGKMLTNHTTKIYFNKGVVYLSLSSAPLRSELMMGRQKLIDSFNAELGADVVKDIVLR